MTVSRRPRVAGLVGALLLIALILFVALLAVRRDAEPPAVQQIAATPLAGVAAALLASAASASAEPLQSTPTAALAGASSAPAAVWDLCGVGRMPVPAAAAGSAVDGAVGLEHLPAPLGEHALEAAGARISATLAAGNDRQRAADTLLGFGALKDREALDALVGRLAAIARNASDPVVLAWALGMCDGHKPSACSESMARSWIAAEPDNAAAWLALRLRQGVDRDEVDRGLAQATRYDVHNRAVAQTVRAAWPASEPPYLRALLMIYAVGIDAVAESTSLQRASAQCSLPLPANTLRTNACSALAEAMVGRGSSLLDLTMGAALGRRVGWPAERVAAVRAEYEALLPQLVALGPENHAQPLACEQVDRLTDWIEAAATKGELALLRAQSASRRAPFKMGDVRPAAPSTDRSPAASTR